MRFVFAIITLSVDKAMIIGYEGPHGNTVVAYTLGVLVVLAIAFWMGATSIILGFWCSISSMLIYETAETDFAIRLGLTSLRGECAPRLPLVPRCIGSFLCPPAAAFHLILPLGGDDRVRGTAIADAPWPHSRLPAEHDHSWPCARLRPPHSQHSLAPRPPLDD